MLAILPVSGSAALHVARSGLNGETLSRWMNQGNLRPGDVLELPCGIHIRETLQVPAGLHHLTIRAEANCGDGQRPVLRPIQVVSDWRSESGFVHSVAVPSPVAVVLVDGIAQPLARFPAVGFLHTKGATGKVGVRREEGVWFTAAEGLQGASTDLLGADMNVRSRGWTIEAGSVAAWQGDRIRVVGVGREEARSGASFTLSGKRWMLDQVDAHGWAWDPVSKRLFLRLPAGQKPADKRVEVGGPDPALSADGIQDLQLSGFDVFGAGLDGVRCERCERVVIDDLRIRQSVRDGINLANGKDLVVRRSQIELSGRDGINLVGAQRAEVNESRVLMTGMGGWPQSSRAAVNGYDSIGLLVQRNRLEQSGYIGIRFNRDARVDRNLVYDSCQALDDCGAIYSWADGSHGEPLNSEITTNIVRGVIGQKDGSPETYTLGAGVYLDDLSNAVAVRGNTVTGAGYGLILHNAGQNTIVGNIIGNCRDVTLVISTDHRRVAAELMLSNKIADNILISDSQSGNTVQVLNRNSRRVRDVFENNTVIRAGNSTWLRLIDSQLSRDISVAAFQSLSGQESPFDAQRPNRFWSGMAWIHVGEASVQSIGCPVSNSEQCRRIRAEGLTEVQWPLRVGPHLSRWTTDLQ